MTLEARTTLYSRLVEVLGDAPAATLMSYLPGDEPATKTDIADLSDEIRAVEARLNQRMDGLEQRLDRLEQRFDRLDQRMDNFHSELRAQTRTFVLASLGSSATLAAAIVAAAAIL